MLINRIKKIIINISQQATGEMGLKIETTQINAEARVGCKVGMKAEEERFKIQNWGLMTTVLSLVKNEIQ